MEVPGGGFIRGAKAYLNQAGENVKREFGHACKKLGSPLNRNHDTNAVDAGQFVNNFPQNQNIDQTKMGSHHLAKKDVHTEKKSNPLKSMTESVKGLLSREGPKNKERQEIAAFTSRIEKQEQSKVRVREPLYEALDEVKEFAENLYSSKHVIKNKSKKSLELFTEFKDSIDNNEGLTRAQKVEMKEYGYEIMDILSIKKK